MIGLDTNVLVRYMAQDDTKQSAVAARLIEKELSNAKPGFISLVVLAELCWVLTRLSIASADELIAALEALLNTPQFLLHSHDVVIATMQYVKGGTSTKAGSVYFLIA